MALVLIVTAMRNVNTAHGTVSAWRGGLQMSKVEAVMYYKTSMSIFRQWRKNGLISREELMAIDTIIAEKYGISSCSIYREIA